MAVDSDAKTLAAPTARRRRDWKLLSLLLIYMTVFIDMMGIANLIPILPFLVGARPHPQSFTSSSMSNLAAGTGMSITMVAFNGAQLISTLVFGPLSDRIGRRPVLLASLVGGTLGYAWQGLAIALGDFWQFVASRILTGLFGGTRPVAVSYISDSCPPEQRPKYIGLLALSVTAAMQFGPLLGGAVGVLSLYLPCFISAALSFVGALLVWYFVPETRVPNQKAVSSAGDDAETGDQVIFGFNVVFSFSCGFWAMTGIVGFALLMPVKFDFDPNEVGLAALGDGIMIFLGTPVYLLLIKRFSVFTVAALGSLLGSLVFISPYLELIPLLVVRYVSTIGGPLAVPASSAIVAVVAPPHRRGAWTGLALASQSLGRTVSPAILGVTFDIDVHLPFLIGGATLGLGGLCCIAMRLRMCLRRRRAKLDAPSAPVDPQTVGEKGDEASKVNQESISSSAPGVSDIEQLSQHAEALVLRLRNQQELVLLRKASLESGQADSDLHQPTSPEDRAEKRMELGTWLVDTMERHNYTTWPQHLDAIKLMLFNAFPPLSSTSELERLQDLMNVFEGHIGMAERSELFDNAEDLMNAAF
eukprot:TRINITY_DN28283_c0_g1_i1.p1 TRINITY_DN28283_c0_g1~~TRINITY_DN28283_c0_g1_i1.p1  ORF type:complete len:614 (-),score=84.83 TRINITY_DN28283_c0_g1_i1:111-1871(-)